MKKKLIFLFAVITCVSLTGCNKSDNKSDTKQKTVTASPTESRKDTDPYFKDTVLVEKGEAYLAIVDSEWKAQYWGTNSSLSYKAGIAEISGNGDYTVSVTTDTDGFRNNISGDSENNSFTPKGVEFMAVIIKEGETKYPNAIITVKEVRVDGKAVEMTAKSYTSSDDGIEIRANIVNRYTSQPSPDARSADGKLYDEAGNPKDICKDYAPQIVPDEAFETWNNIEVDFTISGIE